MLFVNDQVQTFISATVYCQEEFKANSCEEFKLTLKRKSSVEYEIKLKYDRKLGFRCQNIYFCYLGNKILEIFFPKFEYEIFKAG